MTNKAKNWVLVVSSAVSGTIICFALAVWLGHFEASAQTANTAEKTAITVDRLVIVVDKLTSIHEDEDAGLRKVAELCYAGKLTDCDDCAEAGVELRKCNE